MRAAIPQTTIQQAGLTSISVGQVKVGPVQIGRLSLSDFHLGMSSGRAALTNLRITLILHLALDWSVSVHIPFDGSKGWDGTIDLGAPSVTIPLGDVTIPGLQSLTVDVASLTAGPLAATAAPITNLTLGSAVAEQLRAVNLAAPAQGFSIAGLGLTAVRADGVTVPGASVEKVEIGRLHGEALPVGGLTLANVGLPAASVNDVATQGIDVDALGPEHRIHADAGLLDVTLRMTPEARAQIDHLSIAGLQATANIGSIELKDVVAPYELLNITLADIGIEQIAIPTIGVS